MLSHVYRGMSEAITEGVEFRIPEGVTVTGTEETVATA